MNPEPALKPRRVLMTADTIGGVWNYALELTAALAEHNIHVLLATMGARLTREQRRQLKRIHNAELFESTFKLEWMNDPWRDVAAAGHWLLEIALQHKPDLLHLNNFAHGTLPVDVPRIVVGHSCVSSWWHAVKGCHAPAEWSQYREIVRAGLQAAHQIIAPSRAMLEQLQLFYGPLQGRVIYNGRDPSVFPHGRKEQLVFSAGRLWDEAKNIAALDIIATQLPWPVYVAGDSRHPNGAHTRASSLCCLGRLASDLLARWYAKAAIYALPARYEPFGLSILEAGMAGCALVLGHIPSLRELWNGAALFVNPNDPEELRFAIQRLIENPFRRKELAAYAQCRAIQFTPKRMAAEYVSAYTDTLNRFTLGQRAPRPSEVVPCAS